MDTSTVADDLVRLTSLNARQIRAHVDLVDHDLHVDAVAGIRIGRALRVTEDAELDVAPGTTMERELLVAVVARLVGNLVPGLVGRAARRNEVLDDVVIVGLVELELRHVDGPRCVNPQRVGQVGRVVGRECRTELVLVMANLEIRPGSTRVGRALQRRRPAGTGGRTSGVRVVLPVLRIVVRQDETDRDAAQRRLTGAVERIAEAIPNVQLDDRLPVCRNRHVHDLDLETRKNEGDRLVSDVMLELGGREISRGRRDCHLVRLTGPAVDGPPAVRLSMGRR